MTKDLESNYQCQMIGCNRPPRIDSFFCDEHTKGKSPESMAAKYPKYYKSVKGLTEIDVYAVHQLFDIQDPSGAIQHASKKLLLSGVRTGGKSMLQDIKEARDTLTRWIQLQETTE